MNLLQTTAPHKIFINPSWIQSVCLPKLRNLKWYFNMVLTYLDLLCKPCFVNTSQILIPDLLFIPLQILQVFSVEYHYEPIGMLNRVFTTPDRPLKLTFSQRKWISEITLHQKPWLPNALNMCHKNVKLQVPKKKSDQNCQCVDNSFQLYYLLYWKEDKFCRFAWGKRALL